jgi:putative membrane protein
MAMKSFTVSLSVAVFALALPGLTRAGEKLDADGKFIQEATSGGMLEVKLGQMAGERAESSEVKAFAARMVADHTKTNNELRALAQKNGIKLPQSLNAKHQATLDKLKDLRGAAFDRAYMTHMVKDHEEDVTEFTKESKNAEREQVRALATKALPVLQEHLRMAREIASKLENSSKR